MRKKKKLKSQLCVALDHIALTPAVPYWLNGPGDNSPSFPERWDSVRIMCLVSRRRLRSSGQHGGRNCREPPSLLTAGHPSPAPGHKVLKATAEGMASSSGCDFRQEMSSHRGGGSKMTWRWQKASRETRLLSESSLGLRRAVLRDQPPVSLPPSCVRYHCWNCQQAPSLPCCTPRSGPLDCPSRPWECC